MRGVTYSQIKENLKEYIEWIRKNNLINQDKFKWLNKEEKDQEQGESLKQTKIE